MKRLIWVILFAAIAAVAQNNSVDATQLAIRLGAPPQQVNAVSVQAIGASGPRTLYYWVVTNSASGSSTPAGPFVLDRGPNVLSANAKVTIGWLAVPNATSYDVLRTNTAKPPEGACNCAVATGLASPGATDQAEALNAYTVSTLDAGKLTYTLTNEQTSPGQTDFVLRQGGVFKQYLSQVPDIRPSNNTFSGDNAFTKPLTTSGINDSGVSSLKVLNSLRFANKYPNIQAAIDDAGGVGVVVIPRDYAGTDSFQNLSRIPIIDLRGASGHWRGNYYFAGDFGAKGDGIADDTAAIQEALDAAHDGGGSEVTLAAGTYIVTQLKLRDGVKLRGAGRNVTTLKLKNAVNLDILVRHPSDTGLQVGIADLTIDGNDANNTQGGFFWNGANGARGPSLIVDNLKIRNTRRTVGGGTPSGALHIQGNVWSVVKNSDISDNHYAPGLWTKGSDGLFMGNYYGNNGDLSTDCGGVCPSVVVQVGAGNRFIGEYFGGNGGREQVQLWGASRNFFINCLNDNAAQAGYLLTDWTTVSSNDNLFVGGQVTGPQPSYPSNAVDAFSFQGGASGNLISGVLIDSYTATVWRYGINETGSAGNNIMVGGNVGRNHAPGTGKINWRSGGNSMNRGVLGVDDSAALAQLFAPVTFSNLGTPANGKVIYCSDCTYANPCAAGGTGAIAKRLNNAWRCD